MTKSPAVTRDLADDNLEDDPGGKQARARSFGRGLWGIPARTRYDDWIVIWDSDGEGTVVRYIGPDPFA